MKLASPRIFSLIVLLLLLTDASRLAAQEYLVKVPLFGPAVFVREAGAPQTAVREFSVQRPALSYQMQVQSGSPQGEKLVANAVIVLNGAIVSEQKDFNEKTRRFEHPVILQANNHLEVKLNGIAASFITITIDGFYYPSDVNDGGDNSAENQGDCEDADTTSDL